MVWLWYCLKRKGASVLAWSRELNKWFCSSEEYIFIKIMKKEFNNQHHQHQGTYTGWCAWLNANPIPSYMIETNGNFAILKSWKLLSLLNFEWDLKFYFCIWGPMRLEPLSNILKQLMVMLKIEVKGWKIKDKENFIFTLRI